MAHQTLVNGTAYEISGGNALVEGVSYAVKNGKVMVNGTEYDIRFVLPPGVVDVWYNTTSTTGVTVDIQCVCYANGYWVVGGRTGNAAGRIAYTTSLDGQWTIKDLWNGKTAGSNYISSIAYFNGQWVVGAECYLKSDTAPKARIAYTTSLDGQWTIKDLWNGKNSSYSTSIEHVTYKDGKWICVGEYNGRTIRVAYTINLDESWTIKDIWSNNYRSYGYYIDYISGYWIVCGNDGNTARIAYATTLDGQWTIKDLWEGSTPTNIKKIVYANGYWVVGGYLYSTSSGDYGRIAYAESLDGNWTIKDLWTSTNANILDDIVYANGYWVAVGRGRETRGIGSYLAIIAYAASPDGEWTLKNIDFGAEDSSALCCITHADGYWFIGGTYYTDGVRYATIAYAENIEELGNTQ